MEPRLVDIFLEIIEEKRRNPPLAKKEKSIGLAELGAGMLISRDILTTRGTIVLSKGTIITKHHIQYINEFNRLEKIFDELFIYVLKEIEVAEQVWEEQEWDVWDTEGFDADETDTEFQTE